MCSNCALQSHRLQTVHAFYVVGKIHKAYRLSAVFVVDNHTHGNALGNARPSVLSHTSKSEKTDLNRAVPLCILLLFCAFLQEKRGYPTPENAILHPILHPKSLVNTGILGYGCRKCRIFFQNFFRGGEKRHWSGGLGGRFTKLIYRTPLKNIGLLWAKVRMFCIESTDVCLKEVRCF